MPCKIIIIGATGQIGRELVERFHHAGWSVTGIQRSEGHPLAGIKVTTIDRNEYSALDRAVGDGADLIVDTVASTAEHARQLVALQSRAGAFSVISSASVYCDDYGRTLAEAAGGGYPELPIPIPETCRTIRPGAWSYSSRKAAMEQILLEEMTVPLTIVRPGAVYGPGSRYPREWWVLKRLLDGRTKIPLAFNGESRFHTTSARNLAELVRVAATRSSTQILNAADPVAFPAIDIVRAIATAVGKPVTINRLLGLPEGGVGQSPWSLPRPFVLDMAAAEMIGYRPHGSYAELVAPTCKWLIEATQASSSEEAFPALVCSPASGIGQF